MGISHNRKFPKLVLYKRLKIDKVIKKPIYLENLKDEVKKLLLN
jgi:hypothetical protein